MPATSTDACIHVTRDDESRKEHMNKPVLVYVSSDIDHQGNVNILDLLSGDVAITADRA